MSRRGSLICRLLKHSWVRLPTEEEAYRCLRCGKQIFGKLSDGTITQSLRAAAASAARAREDVRSRERCWNDEETALLPRPTRLAENPK